MKKIIFCFTLLLLISNHCILLADENSLKEVPADLQEDSATEKSQDSDASNFKPDQSTLPVPPPKNAIVLYDGKETNKFLSMGGDPIDWPEKDGILTSSKGKRRINHIVSTVHFRDADIHVEFMLPEKGPGNSGIYIHGNYELQIYNSIKSKKLDQKMIGSIYGFHPPLTNAAKGPGEWQVYDIRYRAPRRDKDQKIVEEGSITAWLNGQLVQKESRFAEPRSVYHPYRYGTTDYLQKIWKNQLAKSIGPVFLQDHGNPVKFRNVWIQPLDDQVIHWDKQAESKVKK